MVRLEMLLVVRKDKLMRKKAIVLKAASCVKEWSRSGAPNGPRWSAVALRRVDFQWGWEVEETDCLGGSDSPSIDWCEELGALAFSGDSGGGGTVWQ